MEGKYRILCIEIYIGHDRQRKYQGVFMDLL